MSTYKRYGKVVSSERHDIIVAKQLRRCQRLEEKRATQKAVEKPTEARKAS